jgi:hypothetical protein
MSSKQFTLFTFSSLFAISLHSCAGNGLDSSKAGSGACDTLAIVRAYQVSHNKPELFTNKASFYLHPMVIPRELGSDSAQKMMAAYKDVAFDIPNPRDNNNRALGFVLDSIDFKKIVNDAGLYRSIGLYFGIRNFDRKPDEAPVYTILVTPVMKNGAFRTTTTASILGYDYVDPCPGSPGCPK